MLITAISRYGVRVNLTAWMSVRVLSEEKIQVLGGNSYYVNVILDKVLWSHLTGDWSLFPALYLMFYTNVPILLSLLLVYRIPDIICSYKNRGSQKSSCSTQIRQCSCPSYSSSDTSKLFWNLPFCPDICDFSNMDLIILWLGLSVFWSLLHLF